MADRLQAHDRLKRGWEDIHCQGFRDACSFCQVPPQKRDHSVCYPFVQGHCQQCNVCFNCLVYYKSDSLLEGHRSTWYEAHYRNGLKIAALDEDLSQAQFAQLNEFLDKKGLYNLFISFF